MIAQLGEGESVPEDASSGWTVAESGDLQYGEKFWRGPIFVVFTDDCLTAKTKPPKLA